MVFISSVKNEYVRHLTALSTDRDYRSSCGEFFCEGMKPLEDCLASKAEVTSILWKGTPDIEIDCPKQYSCSDSVFAKASSMKNSPGPVFTVRIPSQDRDSALDNAIILENVQDPGNVGTVLRSANALGVSCVFLTGDCADVYNPKTVRASMGAIYRQRIVCDTEENVLDICRKNGLPVYAASLSSDSCDLRELSLHCCAVAVGNEGNGLSRGLIDACDKSVIIPMQPCSESFNAAVAASIIMWEMVR